jgi:hypothetical protein
MLGVVPRAASLAPHECGLCQGHGVTKHGRVRVVKRPVRVGNDDSGLHFLDSQLFVRCCACGLVCLARRLHMLDSKKVQVQNFLRCLLQTVLEVATGRPL